MHDILLHEGKLYSLTEFLSQVLLAKSKDTVLTYNVSTGVRFGKRKMPIDGFEDLVLKKAPADVLPVLEKALTTQDRVALVLEYADSIAPAGDTSFSTVDDRAAAVTLHQLVAASAPSSNPTRSSMLSLENLTDLHPKLVSNPRVATVKIPMPRLEGAGYALLRTSSSLRTCPSTDAARLAEITAGPEAHPDQGHPRVGELRPAPEGRPRRASGSYLHRAALRRPDDKTLRKDHARAR